jgi:hypothetical protein
MQNITQTNPTATVEKLERARLALLASRRRKARHPLQRTL